MSRAASGAPDRRGAHAASITLENHPRPAEVVDGKITLVDPVVQRAAVPPHHAGGVFAVDLQEQTPIARTGLELRATWILVARCISDEETTRHERAFGLHVSLDR